MNTRAAGAIAEEIAAKYLEKSGYEILERNYVSAGAEIDLIAVDGDTLVFAEVKSSSLPLRAASERVDYAKRARYARAAKAFVAARKAFGFNVRFDVIEVRCGRVSHIKGAFEAL